MPMGQRNIMFVCELNNYISPSHTLKKKQSKVYEKIANISNITLKCITYLGFQSKEYDSKELLYIQV